jgi:RHS repeat-associated protein
MKYPSPTASRADLTLATDYYPFGSGMPGRSFSEGEYRYGFQGQEKDDELKGEGNSINYKYRMHDARVGRFFAVDPLAPEYPWNSPYAFSENCVVNCIDLEGKEAYPAFNQASKVFSKESFYEFVDRMVFEMTTADDVEDNQYDCADFCITLVALYFVENNVAFQYKIGDRIINSEDTKYHGETALIDFIEDLKLTTSASNLRDSEITRKVNYEELSKGGLLTSGGHAMIFLDITESGKVIKVQSSGKYLGRGNPKNLVNRPEISTDSGFWTEAFSWTFLDKTSMEFIEPLPPAIPKIETNDKEIKE